MTELMECGRCGRELKDAKSRNRGYGPKCRKKVQEENDGADDSRRISKDDGEAEI